MGCREGMLAGPQPAAPSKGEAAKEGDPGQVPQRDAGEAATMPCLSPSFTGPGRRGLCQAHLLQHAARRLILLRQRQAGVTQRHQERQAGWAGQWQAVTRKHGAETRGGERNHEPKAEQLWVLPGGSQPRVTTPAARVAGRAQVEPITTSREPEARTWGHRGLSPGTGG